MSIFGSVRGMTTEMRLAPILAIAIWSFLIWKIWNHPRKWGVGVGIFLFLMIALQNYLWWIVGNHDKLGFDRNNVHFILVYQLPIIIAGVSCSLLRFYHPHPPDDDARK